MLEQNSVEWAVEFICNNSDGDLFATILEFDLIKNKKEELGRKISDAALSQISIGPHRRFMVPKDITSFRQATQLDPQDSIILTSIIYQYGQKIENRRLPKNKVFSYRFKPNVSLGMYSEKEAWNRFWKTASKKSKGKKIVCCDIADFYNQIYHHVIENQLAESEIPNQVIQWIKKLLNSTTAYVSRGLPIGPHPVHLLAEMALIPIDNSLKDKGYNFIRYADDYIFFCKDDDNINICLMEFADILDKQQRLMIQKHKTKIFDENKFNKYCTSMIEDCPINNEEKDLLEIIKKYSNGNPYATVYFSEIAPEDWMAITENSMTKIILEYLNKEETDYIRLRWLYRRLSQLGHPGAIKVTLDNFQKLTPCFANICTYLSSVQNIENKDWKLLGSMILKLLKTKYVKINSYFRLQLISLFTRNKRINHIQFLLNQFL